MDDKRKDKIIMGLIIVIVALFANNYVKNNEDDLLKSEISLLDTSSDAISPTDEDENVEINEMKVYISGEISKEGVYEFEDGDRLDDLIKKAGGLTKNADEKDLNLAMKLEDEMKIYIPSIYEVSSNDTADKIPIITSDIKESSKDKVNINNASKEELMSLPNIGDKRADSILEYRESNKFETIEDIKNVNGIGEKFYQSLKDLITV